MFAIFAAILIFVGRYAHDFKLDASADTLVLARLAADTCLWPLFEIAGGEFSLTYLPPEKKPVAEWLKRQGRFRHLFKAGNEALLEQIQADVDRNWEKLLARAGDAVPDFGI